MGDGKASHAGLLRASMKKIVEALRNDPVMIENGVATTYTLDHPSKQIVGSIPKYRLKVEPAGFSQTAAAGELDIQYYSWITLKYKPATHGHDEEDNLSFLCERIVDMLHRKVWGELSTFVSKVMINYKSVKLTSNSREVNLDLLKDEIGAVVFIWQSPKSVSAVEAAEVSETTI